MGVTIKNPEVERLAKEVAQMTGESKTQAIRVALQQRRDRLAMGVTPAARAAQRRRFLEGEIWADIPPQLLDRPRDKGLEDEILGYGADGV